MSGRRDRKPAAERKYVSKFGIVVEVFFLLLVVLFAFLLFLTRSFSSMVDTSLFVVFTAIYAILLLCFFKTRRRQPRLVRNLHLIVWGIAVAIFLQHSEPLKSRVVLYVHSKTNIYTPNYKFRKNGTYDFDSKMFIGFEPHGWNRGRYRISGDTIYMLEDIRPAEKMWIDRANKTAYYVERCGDKTGPELDLPFAVYYNWWEW